MSRRASSLSPAIDAARFSALVIELLDENPLAIRPVLKILGIEFTNTVPTLAVSCTDRPVLLVNLDFVNAHCRSDAHVKALICHEFLHVLLRHTEDPRPLTPARHLAADAVINAIIHRQFGDAYSGMMTHYYAEATDLKKLLRPMNAAERRAFSQRFAFKLTHAPAWVLAWDQLYAGRLVVDDIEALAGTLLEAARPTPGRRGRRCDEPPFTLERTGGEASAADPKAITGTLLGNHDTSADGPSLRAPLPPTLRDALDDALRQMNGDGIWRSPKSRGAGTHPYEAIVRAADSPVRAWRRATLALLKRHALPDTRSRLLRDDPVDYRIPVLSPGDRRAFLRSLWDPFLPEASWRGHQRRPEGTTQVYLDVSGSMNAEMPHIVALLAQLGGRIRRPLWAFSDVVAPAEIVRGQLKAQTSGGTSMQCVIEHLARTRPAAAIVLTDGYIETLPRKLIATIDGIRLHVLVTRDGNPAQIAKAGLPYTQLEKLPTEKRFTEGVTT